MLSIFIPVLNEEKNIEDTVNVVLAASNEAGVPDLDIMIFNDGSWDRTAEIVDEMAKRMTFIRPIHKQVNQGPGRNFQEAVRIARYDRMMMVPGDNNATRQLLVDLMRSYRKADLVISYYINMEERGRRRLIISIIFTTIYAVVFGVFVHYINGISVLPTQRLREMKNRATRFSYMAEVHTKLLRAGCTFTEVSGFYVRGENESRTSLSFKSLVEVMKTFSGLVYDIYFKYPLMFNKRPVRL